MSASGGVSLGAGMSSHPPIGAAAGEPDRARSDSRAWLDALRSTGTVREEAVARLHELLLRAARFEVARRQRRSLAYAARLDDIAVQAADDALVAVLAKLDDYRGASRFTTWAYKFALLEAGVRLRRRAWQEREVVLEPEVWPLMGDAARGPEGQVELRELMRALERSINDCLTEHQREVLVALTLNGVPLDVLAERLGTTRGALYKTLHDARRKLRTDLARRGLARRSGGTLSVDTHMSHDNVKRLLGPAEPELLCEQCFESSTSTSNSSCRAGGRTSASRGCGRTSRAARPVARTTTACATSVRQERSGRKVRPPGGAKQEHSVSKEERP